MLSTCQLRTWGEGGSGRAPPPLFGLRGPVPSRSRALPAGADCGTALEEARVPSLRDTTSGWSSCAGCSVRGQLYFYTLNKTPITKPKPRPPPFPSRGGGTARARRELRMRGTGTDWPWRRRRRCGPRRRPCGGSSRTRPILTRCGSSGGSGVPGNGVPGAAV